VATAAFPRDHPARIFTKAGDVYDAAALERDFNSLWNTGYFEDIKILREQTPKGWRLTFQVKEKPTIRTIDYVGASSVSNSDILDRFKQDKVAWLVESQYDPTRIKKAEVSIRGCSRSTGASLRRFDPRCGRFLQPR